MEKYTVGIDIGGTKCAVILGRSEVDRYKTDDFILDKIVIPTVLCEGPQKMILRIFRIVDKLLNKYEVDKENLLGIGISCGGPLDHKRGIVLGPPNLIGWDYIEIVKMFDEKYNVPCFLENDANAGALAENMFGAAKGCQNVVFLTYGTGMGAGLILDGRLYRGTNDMAGEVGHIRLTEVGPVGYGKSGSFEGMCSGGGIAQLAGIMATELIQMGTPPLLCPNLESRNILTAKMLSEAAKEGDVFAKKVFAVSGEYLGMALAVLIDILNPEIIVCGSMFTRNYQLIWDSALKKLQTEVLQRSMEVCHVTCSGLGENIGDFAALSVVLNGIKNKKQGENGSGISTALSE